MTDSELVPWGKGEKNSDEESEIDPETVCLQTVEALCLAREMCDRVPFASWASELLLSSIG